VCDVGNNRVLIYKHPIHTDAVADFVLGQDGRFDRAEKGTSPHRLMNPEAAIADASGNILITDTLNHRMLLYAPPESGNIQPIGLWGQWQSLHTGVPDFRGIGPASLEYPVGTAISPDNVLWVADRANHRVLGFEGGTMGDKVADYVIGQVDFVHDAANLLDNTCFFFPRDLAVDRNAHPNRLYVADFENSRVLGFELNKGLKNGAGATLVLGQPDFHSYNPGEGASGMNLPAGVAVDSNGGVYVADRENSRVLYFADPFKTDVTAELVIGQPNFGSFEPNAGRAASAATLNRPEGVSVDGEGNLYVADTRNHRVLRFDRPLETDLIADAVWGQQGDFSKTEGHSMDKVSAQTFSYPMKLTIGEKGLLAVTDTENHRVIVFDTKAPDPYTPIRILGQQGRTDTGQDNAGGVSAQSMSGPEGVVFVGHHLYVADTANNRVLFFRDLRDSGDKAERVYGQMGDMTANFIGVARCSARNLWLPSGLDVDSDGSLYVTDREQSRVVVYKAR
ncbi:MAG TPA: NHL repeat-containing protein, partial [bacterium]|nr:NHL repeat-containing protein [bacterium]